MSRSKKRELKEMRQAAAAERAHERATLAREQFRTRAKIEQLIDKLPRWSETRDALVKLERAEKRAEEAAKKEAKKAEKAWGKYSRSLIVQTGRGRGLPITSTAEKTSRAIYGSGTVEKGAVSKGPGVIRRKKRDY